MYPSYYFFSLSKNAIAASKQVLVNIRKASACSPTEVSGIGFTIIREIIPRTRLIPAKAKAKSEAFFIPTSPIGPHAVWHVRTIILYSIRPDLIIFFTPPLPHYDQHSDHCKDYRDLDQSQNCFEGAVIAHVQSAQPQ